MTNIDSLRKFAEFVQNHSLEQIVKAYRLLPETINRDIRRCKELGFIPKSFTVITTKLPDDPKERKIANVARQLSEKFSEEELKTILNSGVIKYKDINSKIINYNKTAITFGVIADTHIGHKNFNPFDLYTAYEEFEKADVDFIIHVGDITEGMSNRPGHIYELDFMGYKDQRNAAVKYLSRAPKHTYYISGNHDRWFVKSGGAFIAEDICKELGTDMATFLGEDEGSICLNGVEIRLWHGEDGASSYASSYRLQKIVESLSISDRPSILIAGHDHKSIWMPDEQGVISIGAGCIQAQTKWMRGKRIPAKQGFWIIKLYIDNEQIVSTEGRWFKLT